MCKIICLLNQKGGVGKTTCVLNIGAGLARLGKKVLLVDLDPQANLTSSLGIKADELKMSVYDLLKKDASLNEVLLGQKSINSQSSILNSQLPQLFLIPSSINLSGAEVEFSSVAGREFLLKEALNGPSQFDYILLDCPPSLGLLTLNALTTARKVYVVTQAEFLALQGIRRLLETVDLVKKRLNGDLEIAGVIGTRYDRRKVLNREIIDKLKNHFGPRLFNTLIRENIALAESPSYGEDIFTYKPESSGAKDYRDLCEEIIQREEESE